MTTKSQCEYVYIEYNTGETSVFRYFDMYERWMDNPWSTTLILELYADGTSKQV